MVLLSLCCCTLSAPMVLRSLHNNTQQPVIYLVDGKSVVVYVVLIWEEPAEQSLPYHSQHFHKTTHLPTVLRSKMSALKLSHQWWEFYKTPGQDFSRQAVRRLAPMGREESEVWITSCINTGCNHTSVFYSTFGAEWPATSVCSFDATNSRYFGGMPPSMHTIDGVET